MAWVFVRLKTRLLADGLHGQGWRVVLLILGALYGLWFSALGFAVLVAAGSDPADGGTIAMLVGTALVIGWTVLPLLGLGSDSSLDPLRLALLPLGRRQLMTGLLAAGLVGIGAAATALVLLGAVIGFAPAGPGAILVVAAAAGQLLICVAASRATLAWLSSTLRTRRGRDLRVVLVALIVVVPQAARFVVVGRGGASVAGYRAVANVAGWLPTALPMRAMVAAGGGHLLAAVVELVLAAPALLALLWWWAASLDRLMTTAEAQPAGTAGPGPTGGEALFGLAFSWLPRTRMGAVAAREFRATWRDPRRRVQLVTSGLLPFPILAGLLAGGAVHRAGLVYAALLIVGLSGGGRGYNQIGYDGRAWWLHEACGADLGADLRGKNVALVLTTLPVVLLAAVILAALSGGWTQLPAVGLLAVALEGVQLAIGNVLSVRAPWPVPQSGSNLWATTSGQGCLVGLLALAGLAVEALVALPFAIAVVAVPAPAGRLLMGLLALPYGCAIWILGLRWAVRLGADLGPEILAAVSQGQAGG